MKIIIWFWLESGGEIIYNNNKVVGRSFLFLVCYFNKVRIWAKGNKIMTTHTDVTI